MTGRLEPIVVARARFAAMTVQKEDGRRGEEDAKW